MPKNAVFVGSVLGFQTQPENRGVRAHLIHRWPALFFSNLVLYWHDVFKYNIAKALLHRTNKYNILFFI